MAGWLDNEVLLQTPSWRKTDSVFLHSSLGVTGVQDSDGLSADAVRAETGVAMPPRRGAARFRARRERSASRSTKHDAPVSLARAKEPFGGSSNAIER